MIDHVYIGTLVKGLFVVIGVSHLVLPVTLFVSAYLFIYNVLMI